MVSFMVRPAWRITVVLSRMFRLLSRSSILPRRLSLAAASKSSLLSFNVFWMIVRVLIPLLSASVVRLTSSWESSRAVWRSG